MYNRNHLARKKGNKYPDHKRNVKKSQQGFNLTKLTESLDVDLLAAALGVSEDTLRRLMEGRGDSFEEQYGPHIRTQLLSMNLPGSWLQSQYLQPTKENINTLKLAAARAQNKEPIRRSNFKNLASKFDGKLEVFADAVEMIPSSVIAVIEGRLLIDEERYSHINPRLIAAGFPDGWLETEEAAINPKLIVNLEAKAKELNDEDIYFAEDQSIPESVKQVTEVLNNTHLDNQVVLSGIEAQPAIAASENNASSSVSEQRGQLLIKETLTETYEKSETNTDKEELTMKITPPTVKPDSASTGTRKISLPLGAMGAARPLIPGRPKLPEKLATGDSGQSESEVKSLDAKSLDEVAPEESIDAPRKTRSYQETKEVVARGEREHLQNISSARVKALEPLFDQARRGAKVTIWRDLLGSSQAVWGNIRKGSILLKDDLARRLEEVMGLPPGWIDNPVYPPETIHDWVLDATVPLPTENQGARGSVQSDKETIHEEGIADFMHKHAVAAESLHSKVEDSFAKVEEPSQIVPIKPSLTLGATVQSEERTPKEEALIPTEMSAKDSAGSLSNTKNAQGAEEKEVLTLAKDESILHPVRPLTAALLSLIEGLAKSGRFTDEDALRLINQISK